MVRGTNIREARLCGYPAGMPYELNAVVGRFDLLRSRTAGIREAAGAPLRQRMGLVPVTEQLLEDLTGLLTGFTVMSPAFGQTLSHWSRTGPIAYVEADFHGGDGSQTAAVWKNGAKVLGPARTSIPGPHAHGSSTIRRTCRPGWRSC